MSEQLFWLYDSKGNRIWSDLPDEVQVVDCPCGQVTVRFDPREISLSSYEIQKRWPRGHCGNCGIVYASPEHYTAGDW